MQQAVDLGRDCSAAANLSPTNLSPLSPTGGVAPVSGQTCCHLDCACMRIEFLDKPGAVQQLPQFTNPCHSSRTLDWRGPKDVILRLDCPMSVSKCMCVVLERVVDCVQEHEKFVFCVCSVRRISEIPIVYNSPNFRFVHQNTTKNTRNSFLERILRF